MEELLKKFKTGEVSLQEVKKHLKGFEDLNHSKIDIQREKRTGFPEIVYGESKTAEQIIDILESLEKNTDAILITRINHAKAEEVAQFSPDLKYHPTAQLMYTEPELNGEDSFIAVLSAGTSDSKVSEEAAISAQVLGCRVERFYDIGVAGIHRLFHQIDRIRQAKVIIVVAGMEGALASVVGGLVSVPIIAVPTSVGYGSNFGGLSALLTMLNSCASGISVVNIDNGFGAAYNACQIIQLIPNKNK